MEYKQYYLAILSECTNGQPETIVIYIGESIKKMNESIDDCYKMLFSKFDVRDEKRLINNIKETIGELKDQKFVEEEMQKTSIFVAFGVTLDICAFGNGDGL